MSLAAQEERERWRRLAFHPNKKRRKNLFTPEEDKIILANVPNQAAKLLPHRKRDVIAQRRWRLQNGLVAGIEKLWTREEIATLRKVYPLGSWDEIDAALPERNRTQITNKAAKLKVRRVMRGMRDNVRSDGHFELIDQIRERCRTDGISTRKMAQQAGISDERYFIRGRVDHLKTVNLVHIMKALTYLGGKLVIDWDDR